MATSDSTTKRCTKCGTEHPPTTEYFYKHKGGLTPRCKNCLNAQIAEWQRDNPDKVHGYKRKYQDEHQAEINAKCRDKWHNDPEFRTKHYARTESWRKRNPDKHKAYIQKYRKTERFVIVNRALTMQRQKREAGGIGYSADDVERQGKSQKWLCWWCDKPLNGSYHIDHLIPLKRGGLHDPSNIVLAHPKCNLQKKDKMPWEYNGRLL